MSVKRWYPQLPHLDQSTQDAFRRAYDGIYEAMDRIEAVATAHNAVVKQAAESLNTAQRTQQKVASLPSFDVLQSGVSSQVKVQSSMLPAHCSGFRAVVGTTSITFYWDGTNSSSQIQIAWPDGTVTKVPLANLTITGLSPSTLYFFYPSFNTGLGVIQFNPPGAPVGVGTPAVAYTAANFLAAAAADGDRMQSLSDGGIQLTTTASGTTNVAAGGK